MQIDTSAIFDSFMLLTILAVLIERSLALVFEQKYVEKFLKNKALKEIIAFSACFFVCKLWEIDVISLMTSSQGTKTIGFVLTAAAIAGGSKASIKLFQDVIGINKISKQEQGIINESQKR